jgi:hypothetical protein
VRHLVVTKYTITFRAKKKYTITSILQYTSRKRGLYSRLVRTFSPVYYAIKIKDRSLFNFGCVTNQD